jgi:preprotein translocase subunit SecG
MDIVRTVFTSIQLILCLILICVIVLQSGKNSGLSAFTGANESYLAKNKAKSRDARLALATKWVAGTFIVLTVVLNIMQALILS